MGVPHFQVGYALAMLPLTYTIVKIRTISTWIFSSYFVLSLFNWCILGTYSTLKSLQIH